jgi:ABC-type phosphate/phosphonate transport system permease subunit
MKPGSGWRRALAGSGLFTPGGLLLRAGILVVVYLVLHALGLRDYATVFTGTPVSGKTITPADTTIAVIYAGAYLGVVFAVPVMVIAAAIFAAARRLAGSAPRDRGGETAGTAEPAPAERRE